MATAVLNRLVTSLDIGGGNFRKGIHEVGGQRPRLVSLVSKELKFNSPAQMIGACARALTARELESQRTVVVSVAAALKEGTGVIKKLTNHQALEVRDIPFGPELSKALSKKVGREIEVVVINDGVAGGWAEFSPEGAMADLPEGSLGMALIIGNGVGGRLFRKVGSGIEPVVGGFEPGHFAIPFSIMEELEITGYYGFDAQCGCGITGNTNRKESICLERLINGPEMGRLIGLVMREIVGNLPIEEILANRIVQHVYAKLGKPLDNRIRPWTAADVVWQNFGNEDVTAVLQATQGREPVLKDFLRIQATLLAHRLEVLQRAFDDQGPITFAFIGSVGHYWGEYLIPHLQAASESLRGVAYRQVTDWAEQPQYRVGKLPPHETNVVGNLYYLLHHEAQA
ncbi:MAG: hypothetical protein ABIE84_02525 [bacterium]